MKFLYVTLQVSHLQKSLNIFYLRTLSIGDDSISHEFAASV